MLGHHIGPAPNSEEVGTYTHKLEEMSKEQLLLAFETRTLLQSNMSRQKALRAEIMRRMGDNDGKAGNNS